MSNYPPSRGRLDDTYEVPLQPLVDSSAGDVGPVDDAGYIEHPDADDARYDLLDEDERDDALSLPGGID